MSTQKEMLNKLTNTPCTPREGESLTSFRCRCMGRERRIEELKKKIEARA